MVVAAVKPLTVAVGAVSVSLGYQAVLYVAAGFPVWAVWLVGLLTGGLFTLLVLEWD